MNEIWLLLPEGVEVFGTYFFGGQFTEGFARKVGDESPYPALPHLEVGYIYIYTYIYIYIM